MDKYQTQSYQPVSVQVDARWQGYPLTIHLLFQGIQELANDLPAAMVAIGNAGAIPPEPPAEAPTVTPVLADDLLARLSQRQRRELETLAADADFSLPDLVRAAVAMMLRMARAGVLDLEKWRND